MSILSPLIKFQLQSLCTREVRKRQKKTKQNKQTKFQKKQQQTEKQNKTKKTHKNKQTKHSKSCFLWQHIMSISYTIACIRLFCVESCNKAKLVS
jgi:hypothetical protein